ncbi:MAG: 50S ribosomal protein L25 [Vicinamibacterales bacterium]
MEATLTAVTRSSRGKNEARRLRAAGQIPAVLYGGAGGPLPVAVDPKVLSRILHSESGMNSLIALEVEGQTTRVILKDYLLDPVKANLLHVDFYRIAMDKPITVKVSVVVEGEAKGVKQQGGVIDLPHREVEIECLPGDIPEHLVVDASELLIGQAIRLKDLAADARWTPVSDPDTMLVHVVAPRAVAEAAPEATPAGQPEPEVIKKGKTDKDEA